MQGTPVPTPAQIGAQPLDTDLTAIAALSNADNNFIVGNGSTWVAESGATARASLGLTSAAVQLYEAGLWTPTVVGTITTGTVVYDAFRHGNYTRFGDFVRLQFTVGWFGGTGAGSLRISGIPFVSNGVGDNFSTNYGVVSGVTLSTGGVAYFQIPPGVTHIDIGQYPSGGGTASSVPYSASGVLTGVLIYQL